MPLTRLSFGTARLGEAAGAARHGSAGRYATHLLQAAYDLGISALDTAPEHGGAEQAIGAFLADYGLHEEIAIATKLPSLTAVETRHLDRHVDECLIASLRRLRAEVVDAYLVRDTSDLVRHGQALVDALSRQVRKGRAMSIGVVARGPEDLPVVAGFGELGIVQHPFNLLDRRLLEDDWPRRLAAAGTRLQLASPLLEGLIVLSPEALPAARAALRPALAELCEILGEFGLSPLDAALAFALSIDPDSIVVSAATREQLAALVGSVDRTLPVELYAALAHRLTDLPAEVVDPRAWPGA